MNPWNAPWRIEDHVIVNKHGMFVCNHAAPYGDLIVSAPALVEALEDALLYIERDETAHGRPFGTGNTIRAALALAKPEKES